MKLYDKIKLLLQYHPELRSSDRKLIWEIWEEEGTLSDGILTRDKFLDSKSTETIRRTRQKIQENFPELQANKTVRGFREKIRKQKGTHIFRETLEPKPYTIVIGDDNVARKVYI